MLGRARLVVAAVVWLAGAPPARAEEEVVELRYTAPPACPARDVVEGAIRARTPNVRLAAPARRVFAITIEPEADGFRGTLLVDQVADKQLAAPRCDDLATALALVTALAIDPAASVVPRTPPARPEVPRASAWAFEADVDGMVEVGVGPEALLAAVAQGRASVRRTYQLELAAIAGSDATARGGAAARFTWLAARSGACRLWLRWGITAGACGDVEIGGVRASGQRIVNQRDLWRLWLAAGVHGSARYPFGSRIFGQVQLGAAVPFVRDRYLFAPNVELHDTPSVTGWLMLGIGVRFP
jgi:hypothetical protein